MARYWPSSTRNGTRGFGSSWPAGPRSMSKTSTFARMRRDGSLLQTNPDGTGEVVPDEPLAPMSAADIEAAAARRRAATHGGRSCADAAAVARSQAATEACPSAPLPPRLRGELVQVDGCEHWWFEDRGPQCTLLVFIDDATGRLMHLQFVGASRPLLISLPPAPTSKPGESRSPSTATSMGCFVSTSEARSAVMG